ncbi:DMT family transporter [Cohnella ginsengisoli]|uniref:DMT family transporter n=1 Tax=Cohnella ginsengisoli TaxID=425004 RepID=A0A9X4QPX8_9BACL|nr:DMT family transporter [Cohnella ginsengisoli]MDG0794854.1 DMT family transporter [Cohnella ginsengisoli]
MTDLPATVKSTAAIYALAIVYAIVIGFSFMFTKLALRHADPFDMLAYRFALSFAALAIPVRAGWIRMPRRQEGRPRLPLLLVSLVYPTAFFGFQSVGLDAATTSGAGIFSATSPIFALLLGALLLKERASKLQLLSVLVSAFGLVFMTGISADALRGTSAVGGGLILLSAVALALYGVLARGLRTSYSAVELSYAMMRTGCLFFVGLALVRHLTQGTMSALLAPASEPGFWLPLLYIAIMSSLVSSWLSNFALSRIEAFKVSLFVNLGNLVSISSGVLIMGDDWSGAQTIGTICMLAGVIGANYCGGKRKTAENAEPSADVGEEILGGNKSADSSVEPSPEVSSGNKRVVSGT